jgi:tRNA(Ile)-lysidine synthase
VTGPAPAVARIRSAVRVSLEEFASGSQVLVAVSGGRDSLALADALAFEGTRAGLRPGALIVDHGLQPGSDQVARGVQEVLTRLGLDPVSILTVIVASAGGPEAAARHARYEALEQAAITMGASAVLLGHTLDDQAETVLMGLARGSGARSLSGMPSRRGIYRRPLLGIDRVTTGAACAAAGHTPWDDPHNLSHEFTRVRVRSEVMPVLERELGPGVAAALTRTADQLRDDDAALEDWADSLARQTWAADSPDQGWDCSQLAEAPAAVRRRVIRRAALEAGVPGDSLRHSQLMAVDGLIATWRGQGQIDLPGGVRAERRYGRLRLVVPDATEPRSPMRDRSKE